jgi:hypothetical protein
MRLRAAGLLPIGLATWGHRDLHRHAGFYADVVLALPADYLLGLLKVLPTPSLSGGIIWHIALNNIEVGAVAKIVFHAPTMPQVRPFRKPLYQSASTGRG